MKRVLAQNKDALQVTQMFAHISEKVTLMGYGKIDPVRKDSRYSKNCKAISRMTVEDGRRIPIIPNLEHVMADDDFNWVSCNYAFKKHQEREIGLQVKNG